MGGINVALAHQGTDRVNILTGINANDSEQVLIADDPAIQVVGNTYVYEAENGNMRFEVENPTNTIISPELSPPPADGNYIVPVGTTAVLRYWKFETPYHVWVLRNYNTESLLPAVPTGLAAGTPTADSITVSWNANDAGDNVTSYTVERTTTPANAGSWVQAYNGAGTSFVDSGLSPTTEYFYRIYATNAEGNSARSANVSETTAAAPASAAIYVNFDGTTHQNVNGWNEVITAFTGATEIFNIYDTAGNLAYDFDAAPTPITDGLMDENGVSTGIYLSAMNQITYGNGNAVNTAANLVPPAANNAQTTDKFTFSVVVGQTGKGIRLNGLDPAKYYRIQVYAALTGSPSDAEYKAIDSVVLPAAVVIDLNGQVSAGNAAWQLLGTNLRPTGGGVIDIQTVSPTVNNATMAFNLMIIEYSSNPF